MTQEQFLREIVQRLQNCGIPLMIAGSLASSYHGEPRSTNDIDLVIDPTADQLEAFVASFSEDYYVSPEAAREALRQRGMFNVIDLTGGWKADFILRKTRPFSVEEFGRRIPARIFDESVSVVTPEDAILSKLEWSRESGSQRQYRDALGVAVLHWTNLDRSYLTHWGRELGISSLLEQLMADAEATRPQ